LVLLFEQISTGGSPQQQLSTSRTRTRVVDGAARPKRLKSLLHVLDDAAANAGATMYRVCEPETGLRRNYLNELHFKFNYRFRRRAAMRRHTCHMLQCLHCAVVNGVDDRSCCSLELSVDCVFTLRLSAADRIRAVAGLTHWRQVLKVIIVKSYIASVNAFVPSGPQPGFKVRREEGQKTF